MCFSEDGDGGGLFIYKRCAHTSCVQLLPTAPPLVQRRLHFSRFLWRKLPCSLLVLPTAGSSLRLEGLHFCIPASKILFAFLFFCHLLSGSWFLLFFVCLFVCLFVPSLFFYHHFKRVFNEEQKPVDMFDQLCVIWKSPQET